MTKDEALRLALEALEELNETNSYWWQEVDEVTTKKIDPAITAIKAALEAKDEPWSPVSIGVDVTQEGTHVMAMRLIPNGVNEVIYSQFHPLAQQNAKDEPVAWMRTSGTGSPVVTEEFLVEMPDMRWNFQQPLYTTPPQRKPLTIEQPKVRTGDCLLVGVCASEGHKIQPQRTWVGLTDVELAEYADMEIGSYDRCLEVEAKLKEKNT